MRANEANHVGGGEKTERKQGRMSRRDFLGIAAAGGALALAGAPAFAQSARPSGRKKVRVGVAGGRFGAMFQFHLHPDCDVVAVTDLRPDRRKRLQDVYRCDQAYNSLEEMLVREKNLDAVAIFTDGPLHAAHTRMCMERGLHVLCAVPACFNLDEAEMLREVESRTGMTYMMAETTWYTPIMIAARQFLKEGAFGDIFSTEAEYHHPGLEKLFADSLGETWRRGLAPMNYPTHSTAHLIGLTGERLVSVTCTGWGDKRPVYWPNRYENPFMNETAFFTTDKGNAFRVSIFWDGAVKGGDRGQWYGSKMSLFAQTPNGQTAGIVRKGSKLGTDDAGFVETVSPFEPYVAPDFWNSEMLPPPMRVKSGHGNSHTFLTHEFIDSLANDRKPAIDLNEALAMTVPGIIAHQSALRGGEPLKIPQI